MHPRSILIPAIAADEKDDLLLEAYSNKTSEFLGLDKKDRSLITLDLGHKKTAGNNAVNKVRKFLHYRRQNSDWLNRRSLHCDGETEGASCELGFALALLVQKALPMGIIATGKLGGIDGQVTIDAVTQVPEKLRLVLRKKRAGELNRQRYVFFTPRVYFDEDRKNYKVADLPEVKQLAALKIDVMPVDSLHDIVDKLKLYQHSLLQYLLAGSVIIVLIILTLFNYPYKFNIQQIQPSKPEPLYPQFGEIKNFGNQPILVCQKQSEVYYLPIEKEQDKNIVYELDDKSPWDISLGWKIMQPTEEDVSPRKALAKYYYYAANITKNSKPQSKDSNLQIRPLDFNDKTAYAVITQTWSLIKPGVPGDNLFLFLVNRVPLNLYQFESKFNARFSYPEIDLSRAKKYFDDHIHGVLPFEYTVKLESDICDKIKNRNYP